MYKYHALTLPKTPPSSACTFPGTLSPLCPLHLHFLNPPPASVPFSLHRNSVDCFVYHRHWAYEDDETNETNNKSTGAWRRTTPPRTLSRSIPSRSPRYLAPNNRPTGGYDNWFGLESGEKGSPQSLPPSTRTVRSTPPPAPAPSITLCGSRWRSCKSAIGYRQKRSILVGIGDTLPWFPVRFRF